MIARSLSHRHRLSSLLSQRLHRKTVVLAALQLLLLQYRLEIKMKTAIFASLVASAAAFAPSQEGRAATQLHSDLSTLRGVGPETAGKVVSISLGVMMWSCRMRKCWGMV